MISKKNNPGLWEKIKNKVTASSDGGKPSGEIGERFLPKKAIEKLTDKQYQSTTKMKREGTKQGKQFVKQPGNVTEIVKKYR